MLQSPGAVPVVELMQASHEMPDPLQDLCGVGEGGWRRGSGTFPGNEQRAGVVVGWRILVAGRQAPQKLASWEHPHCSSSLRSGPHPLRQAPTPPPPVHAHHVKHDVLGAIAVVLGPRARGAAVAGHAVLVAVATAAAALITLVSGRAQHRAAATSQGRTNGGCEQHQRKQRRGVEADHHHLSRTARWVVGEGAREGWCGRRWCQVRRARAPTGESSRLPRAHMHGRAARAPTIQCANQVVSSHV